MPRTGLAYERPSRVSQVLIVCFSLAVVVMAGWLVMMIMLPHDANTMAADPADVPEMVTAPAPRVENTVTAYAPPPANPGPLQLGAPSWPAAPSTNPTSTSSAASPSPARPSGASTTSSLASPEASYRGTSNDDRFIQTETGDDAAELIPLPLPRPRRTAVPVPRPRPRIDDQADAPPPRERTFFDMLVGR
jgi:hypothetical protein